MPIEGKYTIEDLLSLIENEKEEKLTVTDNVPFSVIFPAAYEKTAYFDEACKIPMYELDGSCTRVYIELR